MASDPAPGLWLPATIGYKGTAPPVRLVLRLPSILLAAVSALWATTQVAAQAEPVPAVPAAPAVSAGEALAARVEKAIADYEAVANDGKKIPQRNRALLWLGEIDHDDVTAYLKQQLATAGDKPFAAVVLQAIGQVARPSLQDEVWQALRREAAPASVRIAAANAIVKFGDRGIDKLLDLVRSDDDTISEAFRDIVITALIVNGGDRAHRGLAPLLLAGGQDARLKMLRRLDAVKGIAPISNARIRLVADGDLAVAALAWRQLAVEGHERAKGLAIDVFERLPANPAPAVAADLILGLAIVRDADFYPVLLRLGSANVEPVRRALRTAAPLAAKDPALVQYLATKGLESATPAARDAALVLLREAPKEAVQPLLNKVRAELKNPKKKALDLAVGLHDLLAKDPTWRLDCAALAASKDAEVRTVGLSLLFELGVDTAIVLA